MLIALGGGARRRHAWRAAERLLRRHSNVRVRIASGFVPARMPADPRIVHIAPTMTLARELASCSVAIVGGGVTLYEACALGTPSVALPVVPAQRTAIEACAAHGATVPARARAGVRTARAAADLALELLDSASRRKQLSAAGTQLVDGRGASRVARLVQRRAERGR